MRIKFAEVSDDSLIHDLIIKAFIEYKDEVPPSSALKEKVQSVSNALKDSEQGLDGYVNDEPVML